MSCRNDDVSGNSRSTEIKLHQSFGGHCPPSDVYLLDTVPHQTCIWWTLSPIRRVFAGHCPASDVYLVDTVPHQTCIWWTLSRIRRVFGGHCPPSDVYLVDTVPHQTCIWWTLSRIRRVFDKCCSIMILNNAPEHKCFIIQRSYIGYVSS